MFCAHSVFVCFVWILEQSAYISMYSINWFFFVMTVHGVFSAVGTKLLTFFKVWFRLETLDLDGNITLIWILNIWDMGVDRIYLAQDRNTRRGCCEHGNETSSSTKCLNSLTIWGTVIF